MAESIIPNHPPTSEDSESSKNCFTCQARVDYKNNICTVVLYALVGNRFQQYGFRGAVRIREGEEAIFTPLGKARITGVYCDNCKDACSKACIERIEKSKKRHKLVVIVSIGFLLLAVSAFPLMSIFHLAEGWSPWYILPGLATLLSLYVGGAALADRKRRIASIEKKFSIEAKLIMSEYLRKHLAAISVTIDVSHISYEFGVPSHLSHEFGVEPSPGIDIATVVAKATKEDHLLFVPDDNKLRESVLNECSPHYEYYTDATFGHFYALDYYDTRYWYSISTLMNDMPFLVGFDANGYPRGGFNLKYAYTKSKDNYSYDGRNPPNVRFRDNTNSNIPLLQGRLQQAAPEPSPIFSNQTVESQDDTNPIP